jgi:hypothetical protein
MTKVVIIGEMTLGESFAPPGFPGSPGTPTHPIAPGAPTPPGAVSPPIVLPPGAPDQGLPPIPGQGLPPPDLGPGEIWPPLPPGSKPPSKAYALIAIPGVGYRYTVVDLNLHPDQGLPGRPVRPGHKPVEPDEGAPDQGLPSTPEREPKHR